MKKIVFAIVLLAALGAASYASTSAGGPNYKHKSGQSTAKTHKTAHHNHIVVPVDHYSI